MNNLHLMINFQFLLLNSIMVYCITPNDLYVVKAEMYFHRITAC